MISTSVLEFAYQNAVPQTAFGLALISLVLLVDGYGFIGTMFLFKLNIGKSVAPSRLKAIFFFVICIQMLALTQLASICVWALTLWLFGITPDWFTSIRFSASSFTTLGNFTSTLPGGWHLIPAFIAFSGLFSFAWASSSTISMVNILNNYLDTSKNSNLQST